MKLRLLLALTLGCSVAATAAETPTEKADREAQNYAVLMKHYPARALANREQGAVGFKLTLDRDGEPKSCTVTQSSGFPLLDQETCGLMLVYARFQPESGISHSATITHDGSITWVLPSAPAFVAAPPTQVATAIDPLDKIVCKKTLRTGSLAAYERFCQTLREWDKAAEEERHDWREKSRNAMDSN